MEITFNDLPQAIVVLNKKIDLLIEGMATNKGEEIMNIKQAAQFVKLSESTIEKDKTSPKRYKGSRLFFLKSELLNWMLDSNFENVELTLTRGRKAS